jgi:PadR family transcriptional regulator, regulatory protein PadR
MARDDGNQPENESAGAGAHDGPGGMPKNWLTAVLLLLLREWSSYGYDLMEKAAAFGFAALNPGTLYRVLRQMEKEGLVSSGWDTSGQGPARRIYSITEAGEAYLKLWAGSLEQYRRTMDTFFRLYTGRPMSKRPDPEK